MYLYLAFIAEDTVVGSNNSASVMNSSAVTVDDNFKKSAEKRVNEENSVAAISTTVVTENDVLSWEPVQTLESGWKQKLSKEFQKTYFKNLHKFVHSEYSSKTVFPPKNLILSALNLCSYDKVKVISDFLVL